MNVEQKIQSLQKLLDKAKNIHIENNSDPEFVSWKNSCERTFLKVFGENSKELEQFNSLDFSFHAGIWVGGEDYSEDFLRCFRRDFDILIKTINLLIEEFNEIKINDDSLPIERPKLKVRNNERDSMYNLTQRQKEIIQWIVQKVREENLSEEFSFVYLASGDIKFVGRGIKDVSNAPFLSEGVMNALMASGLILYNKSDKGSVHCTLLGKAYEAVDSNFDASTSLSATTLRNSIFGTPNEKYTYDLFMLMPFTPELKPIYDDHIKKVAEKLNLSIARADNFFSQNAIMQEIWSAIAQASILIADCTNKNPNVFYEIGLAHALEKPVILITQNPDDVPFDLRHRRYIYYTYTPPGMEKFENNLSSTILETKKDFFH